MIPPLLLGLILFKSGWAQFDFKKEVASFVDFGRIPSQFTTKSPQLYNYSVSLSTSSPSFPTTSSSAASLESLTSYNNENHEQPDEDYHHVIFENKKDDGILVDGELEQELPDFGEIVEHLSNKLPGNDSTEEEDIKKRSYGHVSSYGGGHDSYSGGHSSYGGGHDSYSGGHSSYGGGHESYGGDHHDSGYSGALP